MSVLKPMLSGPFDIGTLQHHEELKYVFTAAVRTLGEQLDSLAPMFDAVADRFMRRMQCVDFCQIEHHLPKVQRAASTSR
jgi:hypothetical protein